MLTFYQQDPDICQVDLLKKMLTLPKWKSAKLAVVHHIDRVNQIWSWKSDYSRIFEMGWNFEDSGYVAKCVLMNTIIAMRLILYCIWDNFIFMICCDNNSGLFLGGFLWNLAIYIWIFVFSLICNLSCYWWQDSTNLIEWTIISRS